MIDTFDVFFMLPSTHKLLLIHPTHTLQSSVYFKAQYSERRNWSCCSEQSGQTEATKLTASQQENDLEIQGDQIEASLAGKAPAQ